jgi:hypothetical protein
LSFSGRCAPEKPRVPIETSCNLARQLAGPDPGPVGLRPPLNPVRPLCITDILQRWTERTARIALAALQLLSFVGYACHTEVTTLNVAS